MPAPPILSAQMEPPPVKPVIEMNYVTGEYQVYETDVAFTDLMYNASGSLADIGLVEGRGITGLYDWSDPDVDTTVPGVDIFPPSIRGTALMNEILAATMVQSGGLTAVCEFEVSAYEEFDVNESCPIFWLYRDSVWGDWNEGVEGEVYWSTYIETGVQGEGYFDTNIGTPTTFRTYQGGSAWEASNDRRYRMSGTWCYDLGPTAGTYRYQGGQSIDGQPQGIDTSFGETPYSSQRNLSFMDKITASHFFGVGVDLINGDPYTDDSWWWWPHVGWDIRYLAFYRARPVHVLAGLSKPPHTPIQVGQLYTEVIHKPLNPSIIRMIPKIIQVVPLLPKMANIVVPLTDIDVAILPPSVYANSVPIGT